MVPTTLVNALLLTLVSDVDCISITKSAFVQSRKAALPIDVIFSGIFIDSRAEQSRNT